MQRKSKAAAAACLLALIFLTWFLSTAVTPQEIQEALDGLGPWAPPAYIAAFTLLPAFFFPVAVLALAGGLLFGLWYGSLYTFIGAMLNCALMFLLARFVGRAQVQALIRRKLNLQWQERLMRIAGREGFLLLVILRLIPAVPYNLINYTFGLTDMPLRVYMTASAIGIIPGTLVFINLGDKVLTPGSSSFWLAVGLLLALLAVTALLGKKLFPNQNNRNGE